MLIKLFILRFLRALKQPSEEILYHFVNSSALIKNITSYNTLKRKWRKKTNTTIIKEKYKLKNLKLIKKDNQCKAIVTLQHQFILLDKDKKHSCSEAIYLILLLEKNSCWNIVNIINKETNTTNYNKLLKLDLFNKDFNHCIYNSTWQNYIDTIDKMYATFSSHLSICTKSNAGFRSTIYNRNNAISYARKYALNYNDYYMDFNDNGGDCTNFISQCIHAGGIPLSTTWKPYTNTWVRVNELNYYILRRGFGIEVPFGSDLVPGSIIQFFNNSKGYFTHSAIISEALSNGDYLYCCHSYDKQDYPLSEVYPLFYNKFRILQFY